MIATITSDSVGCVALKILWPFASLGLILAAVMTGVAASVRDVQLETSVRSALSVVPPQHQRCTFSSFSAVLSTECSVPLGRSSGMGSTTAFPLPAAPRAVQANLMYFPTGYQWRTLRFDTGRLDTRRFATTVSLVAPQPHNMLLVPRPRTTVLESGAHTLRAVHALTQRASSAPTGPTFNVVASWGTVSPDPTVTLMRAPAPLASCGPRFDARDCAVVTATAVADALDGSLHPPRCFVIVYENPRRPPCRQLTTLGWNGARELATFDVDMMSSALQHTSTSTLKVMEGVALDIRSDLALCDCFAATGVSQPVAVAFPAAGGGVQVISRSTDWRTPGPLWRSGNVPTGMFPRSLCAATTILGAPEHYCTIATGEAGIPAFLALDTCTHMLYAGWLAGASPGGLEPQIAVPGHVGLASNVGGFCAVTFPVHATDESTAIEHGAPLLALAIDLDTGLPFFVGPSPHDHTGIPQRINFDDVTPRSVWHQWVPLSARALQAEFANIDLDFMVHALMRHTVTGETIVLWLTIRPAGKYVGSVGQVIAPNVNGQVFSSLGGYVATSSVAEEQVTFIVTDRIGNNGAAWTSVMDLSPVMPEVAAWIVTPDDRNLSEDPAPRSPLTSTTSE